VTRPELHAFGNLLTGLGLTVAALVKMQAPLGLWLLTPLWWGCGSVIYTSLLVMFGCLSFKWIGPFSHQLGILHNLLQATRYPLSAYPRWLGFLLTVCVPVGAFHYWPVRFFLGKTSFAPVVLLPPLTALVVAWLAQKVWTWGIAKYESTGS